VAQAGVGLLHHRKKEVRRYKRRWRIISRRMEYKK
jgi:hypothetical protein